MPAARHFRRLARLMAAYRANERGNVLMLTALGIIPIIGMVGAATDYARSATARTEMQAALDTTALMVAREASDLSSAEISERGNKYFNAIYKRTDVKNISVTTTYTTGVSGKVQMTISGNVPTTFMGLLGKETVPIVTSGSAEWGATYLRVAIALDVSGSMADVGKMQALRKAAGQLLSELEPLAENDKESVYLSLVPFSTSVNVKSLGDIKTASTGAEQWIDAETDFGTCRGTSGGINASDVASQAACTSYGGTWTRSYDLSTWQGCVGDRDRGSGLDYDTKALDPRPSASLPSDPNPRARLFPANLYRSCNGSKVVPLTNDFSKLVDGIASLVPQGGTNQTIGLAWAMQTLNGVYPATMPEQLANKKYKRIVILLTDGLNTVNRWSIMYGDGPNPAVDERMKLACAQAKQQADEIYTIQIDTDGVGQSTIMRQCASSDDNFYYMSKPQDLIAAFSRIRTEILKLRLNS